jgi:hypothetical protein
MTLAQIESAINSSGEGKMADPSETVGVSSSNVAVTQQQVDDYIAEMMNNPTLSNEEKYEAIYETAKQYNVSDSSIAQGMGMDTAIVSNWAAEKGLSGSDASYAADTTPKLTPEVAQDLMWRSMTTGASTADFDMYGGYDAVKAMYNANGGTYSLEDIAAQNPDFMQQAANEVAASGSGNQSVLNYATAQPIDTAVDTTTKDTATDTATTTTTGTASADPYTADATVTAPKIDTTGTTAATPDQQTATGYTAEKVTDTTGVAAPSAIDTTGYDVTKTAEDVGKALEKLTPATGTVSEGAQATAATADPRDSAVMAVDTPQITQAQTVQAPDALQVKDEELISSAVDMGKAEQLAQATEAAAVTGQVSEMGTVQGQMAKLMADFDSTNPPAWAAGALRSAAATMAARGLSASSMAAQAIVQTAMEQALPIAQADAQTIASFDIKNLSNRQEAAMLAAQQRAAFLQLDFDQAFQSRVANAARIADVANRNFDASVQIALENSRMAQTVDIANLDAKKAVLIQQMAAITSIETQNLSNLQQAAVQNANAFLQMDLENVSNQQATSIFKAEARIKAILDDANATNTQANFEASSANQAAIKYQELATSAAIANAEQQNKVAIANIDAVNEAAKAKADAENALRTAYMKIEADIAQTNATIAADLARTDATNATNAAIQTAANLTDLNQTELNNQMQLERDLISQAHTSAENDLDRATDIAAVILNTQSAENIAKIKADATTSSAIGGAALDIVKSFIIEDKKEDKK